ncbi:MAG: hypothetical protein ACRD1K_08105 [Acidimicrobiales bacterium]
MLSDDGRWGPPTASLALAAAQARAVVMAGGRALIFDDDGTAAAVVRTTEGFQIVALDQSAGWPETVRRVLSRHG